MIPELGHFSLALAGALSLGAGILGLWGYGHTQLQRSTQSMVVGQFVFVAAAFAALMHAF